MLALFLVMPGCANYELTTISHTTAFGGGIGNGINVMNGTTSISNGTWTITEAVTMTYQLKERRGEK